MFTGIIATNARVIENTPKQMANRLVVQSSLTRLIVGESIAVNGVCLTLLSDALPHLAFDVSPETLKLTTLQSLMPGDQINLERAMLANSRFGGHIVTGHVDTTALIKALVVVQDYIEVTISNFAKPARRYLIPKGSVTLDGVNLTINEVHDETVKLMLVPHTLAVTTLGQLQVGQRVNVEFDYFARIIAHQLEAHLNAGITIDEVKL